MSESEISERLHPVGFHVRQVHDVLFQAGGDIVAGNKTIIHNHYGTEPKDFAKAPYKFLSYFDIGDRDIFFGRDTVLEELVSKIPRHKVLIINGKSGSGKTSLIKAGLIPSLAENGYLYVYFRDYTDPMHELRDYFRNHPYFPLPDADTLSLLSILRAIHTHQRSPVVVVFDQFERFLVNVDAGMRTEVYEQLHECLDSEMTTDKLNLVFSLRDDFYGKLLLEAEAVIPSFGTENHHHNLLTLSRDEARQAIIRPLGNVSNIGFDGQFVEDFLLPHLMVQTTSDSKIEPPHLQIVCNQLYETARVRNRQKLEQGVMVPIDFTLYQDLGETEGMLRDYLDDVVRHITDDDPSKTAVVRSTLKLMIETIGTRKFISLNELVTGLSDVPEQEVIGILSQLQESRVLETRWSDSKTVYSLSHEFMVAKVQSWYDKREMERKKARETLDNGIRQWISTEAVLDGSEIELIELWLPAESLDDEGKHLIRASKRKHRRARLTLQVAFTAVGIAFVLGVVAMILGISAKQERTLKKITALKAQEQESLKLVAEAYQQLYRNPLSSVIKTRKAVVSLQQSDNGELSKSTKDVIAAADHGMRAAYRVAVLHQENRREASRLTGSGVAYLAGRWKQGQVMTRFSDDGRYMLLVTERGKDSARPPGYVYLFDNETLRIVKLESQFRDAKRRRVEHVSFSRSGEHIFVSRQFYVSIYSLDGSYIGAYPFSKHTKRPVHIVEGHFANQFLIAGAVGGLWLVDPKTHDKTVTLRPALGKDPLMFVAISGGRNSALLVFESGCATWLYLNKDEEPVEKTIAKNGVLFAAFHPKRDNIAITTGGEGVRMWELNGGKVQLKKTIPHKTGYIDWAKFTPDGKQLVALTAEHILSIIDLDTGTIHTTIDDARSIDWASRKALPNKSEVIEFPKPVHNSSPVKFPHEKLNVSKISVVSGQTWLLTDNHTGSLFREGPLYRVDGEKAFPFPSKEVNIGSVASLGGYSWLLPHFSAITKNEISVGGHFVYRVEGNSAVQLPSPKIEVNKIISTNGTVWLATNRGAYQVDRNKMVRKTAENQNVTQIYEINGRIWLTIDGGAYVIEGNRVIRISLSTPAPVRKIMEAGGKIWILTGKENFIFFGTRSLGAAHMVDLDGYLAKPVPRYDSKVVKIAEVGEKVWLLALDGIYRWDVSSFIKIKGIKVPVHNIHQIGKNTWVETGFGLSSAPIFRLNGDNAYQFPDSKTEVIEINEINGTAFLQTGSYSIFTTDSFWGPIYLVERDTVNLLPSKLACITEIGKYDDDVRLKLFFPEKSDSTYRCRFGNINLTRSIINELKETDLTVDFVTNERSSFRENIKNPENVPDKKVDVHGIRKIDEAVWLLTNLGVWRIIGDEHTWIDTDGKSVRDIVKVDDTVWLLSALDRAYRVNQDSTTPFLENEIGICGVHKINDRVYFLTKQNGKPGPLLPLTGG